MKGGEVGFVGDCSLSFFMVVEGVGVELGLEERFERRMK